MCQVLRLKRCVLFGYLPLFDMTFIISDLFWKRDTLFDHNIPFILIFCVKDQGIFCKNAVKTWLMVFWKKSWNTYSNKTFIFFLPNLAFLSLTKLNGFYLPTALHFPVLLCCVLGIISFWPWAKSMKPLLKASHCGFSELIRYFKKRPCSYWLL